MEPLLFLAHRIPYPPNKGDKVRSFNLLSHLARRYRIYLGTFVDDPADWRYLDELRRLCAGLCVLPLHPARAKLRALAGLWREEPLTVSCYRHAALQEWVDRVLAETGIRRALVFSSAMGQYLTGPRYRHLHRVLDLVDVDSDKWAQYARRRRWPLRWIYGREATTLFACERRLAGEFAASVLVSAEELALFRRLAPELSAKTFAIGNGVDTDFFDPAGDYPAPYPAAQPVLVFTGAMDYWPNVDAVCWFAREVFPRVRAAVPQACFYIVGARPSRCVRRLAERPGVSVTGTVPDVRPYLAHARAAVAPLRVARGVQNKVLEALAMARPVIATPAALDGIGSCPALERWAGADPAALAERAVTLLTRGEREGGMLGRAWVLQHYDWDRNLSRFDALLDDAAATASAGTVPAQPRLETCL